MSNSLVRPLIDALPRLINHLLTSQMAERIANLPPFAWVGRRHAHTPHHDQFIALDQPHHSGATLQDALDGIVRDVVGSLGYLGAMVATYEKGDELAVRALWFDTNVFSLEQLHQWEQQVSQLTPQPVSLSDPQVARVKIYDPAYAENLSVLAARSGAPVVRNDLYSLFTPIAPPATRPIIAGIQAFLGVKQVIAVPFFLRPSGDANAEPEMVGNLFALKRGTITLSDIATLTAFGRRAAEVILSEQLRDQIAYIQELVYGIQQHLQDEERILRMVADGVVHKLGYAVAMVATHEANGALPIRAFAFHPSVADAERLREWEAQISQYSSNGPISLSNPANHAVNLNQASHAVNLSIIAAQRGQPQTSDDIYALLTPIVPIEAKPQIDAIQQQMGVHQVIAVPFYLDGHPDHPERPRLIGNLLVFTRSRRFSQGEISGLQLIGQQVAMGLHNAHIYRQSEHRRQTAEIFGKMAFGAAASIHALRNHVGGAKVTLQLLHMFDQQLQTEADPETRANVLALQRETLDQVPVALERLKQSSLLLDTLHEPWRLIHNAPTDINDCLLRALNRVLPVKQQWVHIHIEPDLPQISTVSDMLIEAFKVLIKNAVEAIEARHASDRTRATEPNFDTHDPRELTIESWQEDGEWIGVRIRDNGIGIPPEYLNAIFEMGWTTKETGLGFGLFWTKDYLAGLGGEIQIESIWQTGTTVQVRLPVRQTIPQVTTITPHTLEQERAHGA